MADAAPPTPPANPQTPPAAQPAVVAVDRVAAAVRFAWRVPAAAVLAGAAILLWRAFDWPRLWRTDGASFAAFASLLALLTIATVLVAGAALRWLLLACWSGRVGFTWTEREIAVALGPFGSRRLDRARLAVTDVPDRWLVRDEADERLPKLTHPAYVGELAEAMLRFSRWQPIRLRLLLLALGVIAAPVEDEECEDEYSADMERVRRVLAKRRRPPK